MNLKREILIIDSKSRCHWPHKQKIPFFFVDGTWFELNLKVFEGPLIADVEK